MALTKENIAAINGFLDAYSTASPDKAVIPGKHPASERVFVSVLRALGVEIEGRRQKNHRAAALETLKKVREKIGPNEFLDAEIRDMERRP